MLDIKGYIKFMKDNKIFIGAVTFFIGVQIRTLMQKITDKIILPVIKGEEEKINKINYQEYLVLFFEMFVISYLLYKFYDVVLEEI